MGREIERKFRVRGDGWRSRSGGGQPMRQGYLVAQEDRSVRVRVAGENARLTIKGRTRGATRAEFEFPIPLSDAREILEGLCLEPLIEKIRHRIEVGSHTWEVDEFSGANEGLVVAEIELDSEEESFERPPWLGDEVTDDPRYYNANLVRRPWGEWDDR